MAKEFAKKFYKSKQWQKCRAAYVASRFGLCEECGKPGVIVHHKERLTPENIHDPDVALNLKKLKLLCIECHNAVYNEEPTREGLAFDESGDLIPAAGGGNAPRFGK